MASMGRPASIPTPIAKCPCRAFVAAFIVVSIGIGIIFRTGS
jgi:hypothetical protein